MLRFLTTGFSAGILLLAPTACAGNPGAITCVYDGMTPSERLEVGHAIIGGQNPDSLKPNPMVGPGRTCLSSHGWDKAHSVLALKYATSKSTIESAEADLVAQGMPQGALESVFRSLTKDELAVLENPSGGTDNTAGDSILKRLADSGVPKDQAATVKAATTLVELLKVRKLESDWLTL